jgi:hypothetical protein
VNPPDHDRRAPEPPLLSRCAWCPIDPTAAALPSAPDRRVTHGICPACAEKLLAAEGLR